MRLASKINTKKGLERKICVAQNCEDMMAAPYQLKGSSHQKPFRNNEEEKLENKLEKRQNKFKNQKKKTNLLSLIYLQIFGHECCVVVVES